MDQQADYTCPVCFKHASSIGNDMVKCGKCGTLVHTTCGQDIFAHLSFKDQKPESESFTCGLCVRGERSEQIERQLKDAINRMQKELQEGIDAVNYKLEALERRSKPVIAVSWAYLAVFVIVIGVTAFLFWLGWGKEVKASINYNVGEIIGGLLAGTGAAVAGTAYALRTLRKEQE